MKRTLPQLSLPASWLASAACAILLASAAYAVQPGSSPSPALAQLGQRPMAFEPCASTPGQGSYLARGLGYEVQVTRAGVRLALKDGASISRNLRLELTGALPEGPLTGQGQLSGRMNYLVGSDPAQWRKNVPMFSQVRVDNAYPGIDVIYYGNQRRLEYDFIVAPGRDPSQIRLRVSGADRVRLSPEGELVMEIAGRRVVQPRPVIYQNVPERREITGGYELLEDGQVGFQVGDYDRARTLVIDPILSYSTFFGGTDADIGSAVKIDPQGSVYIAGQTLSPVFPVAAGAAGYEPTYQGGKSNGDAFVAKFDNSASNLVYFTYLGGSEDDGAFDMAVDALGQAYVTGFTDSPDFPVFPAGGVPGIAPALGGKRDPSLKVFPTDAFVAQLSADGSSLVYSTFLGGSDADVAGGIAVDAEGSAYITGNTYSTNFPVLNALVFQVEGTTQTMLDHLVGTNDAFVTRIAPGGGGLVYSTYLGGGRSDQAGGIALDAEGYAWVTGYTGSTNFPVTPDALQKFINQNTNMVADYRKSAAAYDAFLSRIAPAGGTLVYSTLLGGVRNDSGFRVATDFQRNVYVTGSTFSPEFTNNATAGLQNGQTNQPPNSDAFLTKFDSAGNLLFSALFGSKDQDVGWDVSVQPGTGNAFVVGITASTNFPTANAEGFPLPAKASVSKADVFVSAFNADGSAMLYSVVVGGSHDDYGFAVTADPAGNAYFVGRTTSQDFPLAANSSAIQGSTDAFLSKISLEPVLQATAQDGGIRLQWEGFAPEYVLEASGTGAPEGPWAPVPVKPVFSAGRHVANLGATNNGTLFRLKRY